MEVRYINEYESSFTLFLQLAPELWVYMSYDGNNLTTFSSNERYNSEMLNSSRSRDKFIPIKVGEESIETILAAKDAKMSGQTDAVISDTADLWFHTMVMLSHLGTDIKAVINELDRRFGVSGFEEKTQRQNG